ncbi:MAG TPA: cation diffusion facilitator family transporter [Gemmatimonadaceae bacterium]|nr:cation diffusion facilitator family transporter [Gemmatimonadaceae bacterium]
MRTPTGTEPLPSSLEIRRTPAVRETLLVILGLNALVLVVKIAVGVRTGALSVLGAALESGLDLLNNVMGIVIVRLAAQAPDEQHPYGHEKFETLGTLAIVGFLSISCFELLRQGVDHLLRHHVPRTPTIAELALIGATMLINFFVVWYERRRGRLLRSSFLMADAEHTRSDIFVTAAALGSLALSRAGLGVADPILAIIVALVIAYNGYHIVKGTVPVLVDERGIDAQEIRRLVATVPLVEDVRTVRSRASASGVLFAEVTIGVAASTSVSDAHRIADSVEGRIAAELGPSEVIVHVEPA